MLDIIKDYFIRKYNLPYQNRIKDLERTIEVVTGRCQVLEEGLQRAQKKEDELLKKIFELTGVEKRVIQQTTPVKDKQDFISIGASRGIPWPKVRQQMEQKALEEYWKNKNKETEQRLTPIEGEEITQEVGELNDKVS